MSLVSPELIIISGGQTGADRAGLDFALEYGFECGGCCPAGRKAEDGMIPLRYPLIELTSSDYRVRTRKNILDSTGTLLLYFDKLEGGSLLTDRICREQSRPVLCINGAHQSVEEGSSLLKEFIDDYLITVLNIAGQRASREPRVYEFMFSLLKNTLIVKKNT